LRPLGHRHQFEQRTERHHHRGGCLSHLRYVKQVSTIFLDFSLFLAIFLDFIGLSTLLTILNSFDLSVGAFQAIADLNDGEVPITWHFN
jgi:hypothetical protein